jgi:beta-glucanase (GH16 family)
MINLSRKFSIVLIICAFSVSGQTLFQIKKDTIVTWYYYDGDEFNDTCFDEKKWIPAYSWSNLNYDFKYLMTPKRLEFENGICHFVCDRDTGIYEIPGWQLDSTFRRKFGADIINGNKFPYYFTAGNLWSKSQYKRGYFEIRFKATDAYGIWPAFWMYGRNDDEIDFFELKGERVKDIHVDVHCRRGCDKTYKGTGIFKRSFGGWIRSTRRLNKAYNVISGEWQDGYIKWYLNGQGIAYFKGDLSSEKMSLMVGTGPAEDGKPFAPGVNPTTYFPNRFDVDYIRVWYKDKGDSGSIAGKKNMQFDYFKSSDPELSRLKRKIKFMYSRKEFKKDIVTVSVLPKLKGRILFSASGEKINYTVKILDADGNELQSRLVQVPFAEIEMPLQKKGDVVKVRIEHDGKSAEDNLILQ